MVQEKFLLTEADKNLASAICKLTKQNQSEIEAYLVDPEMRENYLTSVKTLAEQKSNIANQVLTLLQGNNQDFVKEQAFLQMEKIVLDSLPENERTRIVAMHKRLQAMHHNYFESAYRNAILLIYEGKVVITNDSVQYIPHHKALDKKTLSLPLTDDRDIDQRTRRRSDNTRAVHTEVKCIVLDKDNPENKHYHLIQEAQEKLQKEGKYIATWDNTFKHILESFPGGRDEKRKIFQYLTGFVGKAILDMDACADNGHIILKCESDSRIVGAEIIKAPGISGALFIASDI